jgi:formamidopyrimidine-DNA glycosylase
MPELPEVETSRRGIEPHILKQTVKNVLIRQHSLRWPIPAGLPNFINRRKILSVERRAKYILLRFTNGTVILHLGMSGSLRICTADSEVRKHDHIDFVMRNGKILRLHDPRRFGCVLWTDKPVDQHKLLRKLGPEPLSETFSGEHLHHLARKRRCSIKSFIMNSHIVVGVGNIYASESLFIAGINPKRKAGSVSLQRYQQLAEAIKQILTASIEMGGTTLRDFANESGQPGYFAQQLYVYGLADQSCQHCGGSIKHFNQQQRSTFYCPRCQT